MWTQRHNVVLAAAGVLFGAGVLTPFAVYAASFENGRSQAIDWWPNPWIIASSTLGFIGLVLLVSLYTGWPIKALAPGRDEAEAEKKATERSDRRNFLAARLAAGKVILETPITTPEEGMTVRGEGDQWVSDVADWIEVNRDPADRAIFLDGVNIAHGLPPAHWESKMVRAIENITKLLDRGD